MVALPVLALLASCGTPTMPPERRTTMAATSSAAHSRDARSPQERRAREWLAAEGYEQIQSRQGGAITSHLLDGYTVTVAEWSDGRVELNVESPCLAASADGG